jgi:hypothetical protein
MDIAKQTFTNSQDKQQLVINDDIYYKLPFILKKSLPVNKEYIPRVSITTNLLNLGFLLLNSILQPPSASKPPKVSYTANQLLTVKYVD